MSVQGGIQLGKDWIIQPLTDFVWTGTDPDIEQDGQIARVAQLFYCLRTALKDLETRYKALGSTKQASLPCFPYITSYGGEPNGKKNHIQKATTLLGYAESDSNICC